jgi:hypothetical protein
VSATWPNRPRLLADFGRAAAGVSALEPNQFGMHALLAHRVQQHMGRHRRWIVLDVHEVRLLVVVCHGGNAGVAPDHVGELRTAVVVEPFIDVNYDVGHRHVFHPLVAALIAACSNEEYDS